MQGFSSVLVNHVSRLLVFSRRRINWLILNCYKRLCSQFLPSNVFLAVKWETFSCHTSLSFACSPGKGCNTSHSLFFLRFAHRRSPLIIRMFFLSLLSQRCYGQLLAFNVLCLPLNIILDITLSHLGRTKQLGSGKVQRGYLVQVQVCYQFDRYIKTR